MNTTTKKERLLVLNHYYSEHLPKDGIDIGKLFYDVEQAINWKDSVEPDGYTFDFYDYFETCVKEA